MEGSGAVILARFAFFVAASVVFGAAIFPIYAGSTRDSDTVWLPALIPAASAVALVAALAWLALAISDFGGGDLASFLTTGETVLFATSFGPAWLARVAVAAALVTSAALWPRRPVLVALATVLLGSESWIGHAAIGGVGHRIAESIHVLSAAAWLGGLPPLARALADGVGKPVAAERAWRILLRFSAMGMVAVTLIAATGVINRLYVAGPRPQFGSEYDRVFVVKVVLFLGMLGVALFNRFGLVPQLAAAEARPAVLRRFSWTLLLEQGLGLMLLLAASFLGMTSPPE